MNHTFSVRVADMNDDEQRLAKALARFGWTCSDEFWNRYYSDPWVFNLANAVERLTAEQVKE